MKNLLLLLTTVIVAIAFSGCGFKHTELGYYVSSDNDDTIDNHKIKVYYEDTTPKKIDNILLKFKDFLENDGTYYYKIDKLAKNFKYNPKYDKNDYATFFNVYTKNSSVRDIIINSKFTKEKKKLELTYKLKNNNLIVNKKYNDYGTMIADTFRIFNSLYNKYYHNKIAFVKNFGDKPFILLDDELFKNKILAFSVLRKDTQVGKEIKGQIKANGYQLVSNKNIADKLFYYQDSGTFFSSDLKRFKNLDLLDNMKFSKNLSNNFGIMSMNVSKNLGHSSLHSAQIGLGLSAINFLASFFVDREYTLSTFRIIDKKSKTLETVIYPNTYYHYDRDQYRDDVLFRAFKALNGTLDTLEKKDSIKKIEKINI